MKIIKGTDCSAKFKVYNSIERKKPVDLTGYVEFICAITEHGRVLIEKKFSTNDMKVYSDLQNVPAYIVEVKFRKEDTANLMINPSDEERIRTVELFGIDSTNQTVRFTQEIFYLEGSGYYVRRNRN